MNVTLVIFGSTESRSAQGLAGAAAQFGGDARALVLDGEYQPEPVLAALAQACQGADVILFANDTYSQELAPRLAHRLGGACVGDGVGVQLVDGRVRVTRQVYGGKANAVIELRRSPAVVWLRARSFPGGPPVILSREDGEGPPPSSADDARIRGSFAVFAAQDDRSRIVERHESGASEAKLEDAQVIVSGGRGIGGPEGFREELEPLAKLLGAQMAASRAACDAGWVPPTWQVGQTGRKVAPALYLAVAITGASQHIAGISEAKTIAAINIDPDAPIFKHCRFGIVDDYRKVVPLLRRKLEAMKRC